MNTLKLEINNEWLSEWTYEKFCAQGWLTQNNIKKDWGLHKNNNKASGYQVSIIG